MDGRNTGIALSSRREGPRRTPSPERCREEAARHVPFIDVVQVVANEVPGSLIVDQYLRSKRPRYTGLIKLHLVVIQQSGCPG